MKKLRITSLLITSLFLAASCKQEKQQEPIVSKESSTLKVNEEKETKIKVLNLGTFHFGFTSDATTTAFDEKNKKNQEEVHQIAQKLAKFKPTVILVETVPEFDDELKKNTKAI